MKRLLLFLLVFAAGLGVLLLVQRGQQSADSPGTPADQGAVPVAPGGKAPREDPPAGVTGPQRPVELSEAPGPGTGPGTTGSDTGPGTGSDTDPDPSADELERPGPVGPAEPSLATPLPSGDGQVRPTGKISVIKYDGPGGPPIYRLAADDVRSVSAESYELTGVTLELHDRATGELRTRLEATSARVKAQFTEAGFVFDENHGNVLTDVELSVLGGSSLAPLRANVPRLTVRLGEQSLRSEDQVVVEGRGLQITGQGLLIDRDVDTLRIDSDPHVLMRFEDGTRAELSSEGALLVAASGPEGQQQIELTASDAARLDFTADKQARLAAGRIRLLGQVKQVEGDDNSRFAPDAVDALDGATFTNQDGVFEGDRGRLLFDAEGSAERAILVGQPRLRFDLSDLELGDLADLGVDLADPADPVDPADPKRQPDASDGRLPLEASGAGPIEIALGPKTGIHFAGPVELRMPSIDMVVNAEAGIEGSRYQALDRITLSIRGAVVVRHGAATLEAPELVIDSVEDTDAEGSGRSGRLTTLGPTRTTGELADGSPFTLTTEGRLILERNADGFLLPLAEGVDIDVRGDEPFVARADTLRDFVEAPVSFLAEGDVRFSSAAGEGSGQQLLVEGREHVVISGEGERARFDFTGGWLEAEIVELEGDVLDARGGVEAALDLEDQTYRLSAGWLRVDQAGQVEGEEPASLVLLDAVGEVVTRVAHKDLGDGAWSAEIASDTLRLKAAGPDAAEPVAGEARFPEPGELEPLELTAEGNVNFGYSADFDMNGRGGRLVLRADGTGELSPPAQEPGEAGESGPPERIQLEGRMPGDDALFTMKSLKIEFSTKQLIADGADLLLEGLGTGIERGDDSDGRIRVVAGRMATDEGSILLTGGAHISRDGGEGDTGWFLYADQVLLQGAPESSVGQMVGNQVRDMLAWGGFVASFGVGERKIQASGDYLQVIRESEVLKIFGDPAVVELQSFQWASEWFELDLKTSVIRAGPGRVRGSQTGQESWQMTYNSIEPVEYPGETIQVIREPVIVTRNEEVRAAWAMFWVDNTEWSAMSNEAVGRDTGLGIPLPDTSSKKEIHPDSLFGRLQAADGAEWLREIYLEGNVSYSKRGQRLARADAIYLDLIDGHGWLRRVDLSADIPFMDDGKLKLRARWVRHSADGSFFASNAVATTCSHEEPHYVVRIGDLTIAPRTKPGDDPKKGELEEPDGWDISTENTSLRLYDQFEVPLPRIGVPVTPDLKVDAERLSLGGLHPVHFGRDSKLGTFIGTTVTRDLGWLAKTFHKLLTGGKAPDLDLVGKTDYSASWNNDRGVLLGLESEFSVADRYHFTAAIDGLFDRGEDNGLIRVPEDERSSWRAWYRTRGRYDLGQDEWIDAVVSVQEDSAVQSEFFENDFLDFEERESFLHWRKADGADYTAATVEAPLNDFQTEIVSQELLHARGRTAVAGLTEKIPLVYSSATSLAYLDRQLGDLRFPSPFDPRFVSTDGWDEKSALRLDTKHRLESPFSLGVAGLRATPFLEARGTAWKLDAVRNSISGPDSAQDPMRISLLGGIEVGTTVWRVFRNGIHHVFSPFVGYRQDVFTEEDDEPLVQYDQIENPIDGRFFDLGLRTRVDSELSRNFIDLELVQTYAAEYPDRLGGNGLSGWLPLQVNGGLLAEFWGMGLGLKHDARYDTEANQTPYSRTVLGLDPTPDLGFEVGYHNARDLAGNRLYNALSTGARYAFSRKWELDGRYLFSTQGSGRLASEFGIRRFGHDFVFEVSTRFRQGEGGGTSFQFDIVPLLAYDEPGDSLVERWRRRRY